jgi:hypothetical protein
MHEEEVKATTEWSTGSMKFLAIIFLQLQINLTGMA